MKESLGTNLEKKNLIDFNSLKKAIAIVAIALSSMHEAKAQHIIAVSYQSKDKPETEAFTKVPEMVSSDAKKLETAYYHSADTVGIDIANYYETDKPNISLENINKISQTINSYLSNLNKNNIKEFLANDIVLRISCDPRHTNFEGTDGVTGNFALAKARSETAISVIKETLDAFSSTELSSEEVAEIKEKFNHIEVDIPLTHTETNQGEDGVVDYHNMINPETNKTFTDTDWTELQKPENEAKMLEIYKTFRYATLVLMTLSEHEKIKVPETLFDFEGYDEVQILFDDSPSMMNSRVELASQLETIKTEKDIPIKISGFTSKIDTNFYAKNVQEASHILRQLQSVDDDKELAVDGVLSNLNNIKNEQNDTKKLKKKIIVCTDEELQGVSKEKLDSINKLAAQNNVTIQFIIKQTGWNPKTHKEEPQIHTLSMSDIDSAFQKKFKEDNVGGKIENLKYQIKINEKYLKIAYDNLSKTNNQTDINKIQKNISNINEDLKSLNHSLVNSHMIDIDDFN